MFALLVRRDFARLWVAHTVSIAGDYIFFIAITFWVYARTGSSLATGAVLVCSTLPLTLLAPLAGWAVDHYDRRRVMLLAEGARALLFLLALAAILWRPDALWPIYVVGFTQSALAAFFWPARSATLPQFAPDQALLAANALYQFSDGLVRVVAPTLATLALLRLGAAGVVALDAATFVISAMCIAALAPLSAVTPPSLAIAAPRPQSPGVPDGSHPHRGHRHSQWHHSGRRQLRVAQAKQLQGTAHLHAGEPGGIYVIGAVVAFTGGMLGVLLPIFVRVSLDAGPLAYGWLFTAQALGEVVVSALLARRAQPTCRATQSQTLLPVAAALVGAGATLIITTAIPALALALAMNLLFGALTAFASVKALTMLQCGASAQWQGRALARYAAIQACAQLAGLVLASAGAVRIQVRWLIAWAGVMTVFSGAALWGTLCRRPMFHVKHRVGR